jgi:Fe-S-cluster-containing dehydrogenase component
MSQWNLIIDVARCENCNNCVLANKDEYVGNDFPGYTAAHPPSGAGTIQIHRQVRGDLHLVDAAYLPALCNHCDDAPCVKAGGGCVSKRADGIVIIDPVKSKGRKDLVDACPYGSIVWNEEQGVPQNWIFDAHLLDQGWKEPRCVQSCPTDAMRSIKVDNAEMARLAAAEGLTVLKPELATKPRVYYKNAHRFTHCFVGGSVLARHAGVLDCVSGAHVELFKDGKSMQVTQTDAFGDFKFDGLAADSGRYNVRISHAAQESAEMEVLLGQTQVLGNIELSPSVAHA